MERENKKLKDRTEKTKQAKKPQKLKLLKTNSKDLATEYDKLKAEEERLDKEISEFVNQGVDTDLNPQMAALHQYNEMKDVTQTVLGYLANVEQTTLTEIHKLYNLPID